MGQAKLRRLLHGDDASPMASLGAAVRSGGVRLWPRGEPLATDLPSYDFTAVTGRSDFDELSSRLRERFRATRILNLPHPRLWIVSRGPERTFAALSEADDEQGSLTAFFVRDRGRWTYLVTIGGPATASADDEAEWFVPEGSDWSEFTPVSDHDFVSLLNNLFLACAILLHLREEGRTVLTLDDPTPPKRHRRRTRDETVEVGRRTRVVYVHPEVVDRVVWRRPRNPDSTGTGSPRSPHDRVGHMRKYRSGKEVFVRACKIKGGRTVPPEYEVRLDVEGRS